MAKLRQPTDVQPTTNEGLDWPGWPQTSQTGEQTAVGVAGETSQAY